MLGYLKATVEEKRSANKDRMHARHLRRHFGGRVMNTLQPLDVREYITMRKDEAVKNATINREIALLSSAINYANHDLRHTCAAWLVSAGVLLTEVRDLLGHASVVITERYAHLSPDNVRAAVARLDEPMSRNGHAGALKGI
jgi:site-specific recombinase XerD